MIDTLYPIKFAPILKDKIWGGQKLKTLLNKKSDLPNIGESWEISDVEGDTSIVSNGSLKGQSLKQLLETYKSDLLGLKNYEIFKDKFPLLIKFIDAKEDLSIQLHPNDELAAKRHNSFGKTEMWYVFQADKGSNLIVGFNQDMTPEKYLKHLENKTLTEILNFDEVKEGDTYFIEVGRVHAIGAGVMVAEIQQTSDITYRVYDWDRVDANGNERDLHNDLAIDAIDFNMPDNFRVTYNKTENQSNEMVSCPYFTTNYLKVNKTLQKENHHDSFIIYMCVDGEGEIKANGFSEAIKKGETILLPAAIKDYEIASKDATLLEVYL
ncbi:Putative mannose-6-phosphate isomerase YvyI [Mariniflexile rhizosphaerae]|uniref:type I phosphomannose isomerase catalytic subunit n=1 Tax=unclassified Mariniflexile TaxID=2643887 RepID=UPI000CAE9AE1|nr:type I phosphomannose isomerase catalytic subunit [Mariniflexile sp. TRM1-10]AXP81783.1 Putative mannose-6-phosphate isomerase YvyI [Mariniflexile sp. TRM1-10]PLB20835.1 MAG: Mannose-6-phosphate isomerase [Flavobacteriaceae bacterium FS1-H7996/R]